MIGWNDLPVEMRFEIIRHFDYIDRYTFAKCSLQCLREIIRGGDEEIENIRIECFMPKSIWALTMNNHFIEFQQLGYLCRIKYRGEILWKGIESSKNMAYEFIESILKQFQYCVRSLTLENVDFMAKDESIDTFPWLESLSLHNTSINSSFSFLSKAENITSLYINVVDLETIGKTSQINLPVEFKLLSIEKLFFKTNCAHFASNFIDRLTLSAAKKQFSKVEFYIFDQNFMDVDQKLMEIFKKSENVVTNLRLTNEQFVELANLLENLECNAEIMDPSKIIDFLLKFKTTGRENFLLEKVDKSIMEFGEILKFTPATNAFNDIVRDLYYFKTDYVTGMYRPIRKTLRF
ncbi:unnamed protein product [Caenorhabditis angaria]|uniref:F-box domain-containing protein n=1 Tax=Caenorhabditis angaria TaxID=860376 RepID=A0A9P1N7F8_9PELO|nr:unnamed protein product [Caenorhabditis angaria]